MTVIEAKSELREYRTQTEKAARLWAMYVEVATKRALMTLRLSPNAENLDKLKRIERMAIREKLIKEKADRALKRSEELRKIIDNKLSKLDEFDRQIISRRYYNGRSVLALAFEFNYEYSWFSKLHARAIRRYARQK